MSWVLLVIVAVTVIALEYFNDNYITDYYFKGRGAPAQKYFYVLPQILFGVLMLIIFGVDISVASPIVFIALFGSGFIASIANVFFYKALELDDSTNVGIFSQFAPVVYLVLGWFFLGEGISAIQLVAFAIIISASVLLIITARKRSRKIKLRAALFMLIFVIISVIGILLFVRVNSESIGFITEIAFVFLGKGIGNAVVILFSPKWRRRYHFVIKESHRKALAPLFWGFILGIASESSYRGALVLAPTVALGSVATDSAVPIAIFFMGILLTLIWPKFGREKLDRKSIIVHLVATVLVVVGIILIQA